MSMVIVLNLQISQVSFYLDEMFHFNLAGWCRCNIRVVRQTTVTLYITYNYIQNSFLEKIYLVNTF
jgi:hypothetical protein